MAHRPLRRLSLPRTLAVSLLAAPAALSCNPQSTGPDVTDVAMTDAVTDAPVSDAANCAAICAQYDPTSCSNACGAIVHADGGVVSCSGSNLDCVPLTAAECCCCVAA